MCTKNWCSRDTLMKLKSLFQANIQYSCVPVRCCCVDANATSLISHKHVVVHVSAAMNAHTMHKCTLHTEYDETPIKHAAVLWPGTYCLRFIIIKTLLTWAIKHLIGLVISFLFGFSRFFFFIRNFMSQFLLDLYEMAANTEYAYSCQIEKPPRTVLLYSSHFECNDGVPFIFSDYI